MAAVRCLTLPPRRGPRSGSRRLKPPGRARAP